MIKCVNLVVILVLGTFEPVKETYGQKISGDILANELNRVADAVGRSFIQEIYNKMHYNDQQRDGQRLSQDISKKIAQRMENIKTSLNDLKRTMEDTYDQMTSSNTHQDCCVDGTYQKNLHFRTRVSLDNFCYNKPSYVENAQIKYPTVDILTTMKDNHQNNKNLQFQYIAFTSGLFINYPSTKLTDCSTFDPRFRPFFVSSTTSNPRDVVLVLDISASMMGDKLSETRDAAITVMETLSVQDRIAIVLFNNVASSPNGCYNEQLVPVTRTTKDVLEKFINSKGADGGSNYEVGLRKAFEYFKTNSSEENAARDSIILFVTDGNNIGGNPLEVIKNENHRLQNRVVINTYGIGNSLSSQAKELLLNMSKQTLNEDSYGYVISGKSYIITDVMTSSLRGAMGTYYDYSSVSISQTPTYTQPYKDFFSKEFVVTGCVPIVHRGAFVGVACADVLLSELVTEIIYLQQGEFSYVFIIDGEERTLIHPLLPDPRDVNATEYDVNNIFNFETSGDVHVVIDSMKRAETGQKTLLTTIFETRGDRLFDGDSKRELDAVYYWAPIVASGSNFSLCLVMSKNNSLTTLADRSRPSVQSNDFVYHRWDLTTWPQPFCRHFSRYATKAKTTIKLTPDAFLDPYEYTYVEETETRVKQYTDYLSGTITTNPGLKVDAINSIRVTYPIEDFWKTISYQDAPYLVWRYIMTEDGVQRIYPGIRLTNDYDHKIRPWYRRTVAQKLINVVSAPYEDSWGSGKVISLTRAILKSGTNPGMRSKIEAVIGTDFSIYHFNQILKDRYPICANKTSYSCIVIDNSGFLVMHPSYIETPYPLENRFHITNKEGRISRSLISSGIMYRQPCRDTENKKEQFTYRVRLPQSQLNGVVYTDEKYEIRPVTGSNVFLILKEVRHIEDSAAACCSMQSSSSPSSQQCGEGTCTCLCYKGLDFNECENKYESMEGKDPCNPNLPTLESVSTPEEDKTRNLETCFPTNCPCRKTESECFRTSGCSWCTSSMKGTLVKGFCDLKETCPSKHCVKKECSSKCCGSDCMGPPESKGQTVVYVGSSAGGIVFIIIIIVIVCFIVRHKRRQEHGNDGTYIEPTHVQGNKSVCSSSESVDYQSSHNFYVTGQLSETSEENLSEPEN
ncbi:VWFA and cache domain-containing protein 1-like [Saccostrea echinata]|uniref:VWFA and cache domain-containing protein 1-like n=1 Tax=Saccostrea echinata TaxID=191078 RepID=UPI002A82E88D|nr:VWFA and cache domain-containing protein 1-like [Saccostrea echinata]